MGQEHRRAKRFNISTAVRLILRDTKNRLNLGDPVAGSSVDISLHGARLSLPHIRTGRYHFFYACSDDPNKVIHLEIPDRKGGRAAYYSCPTCVVRSYSQRPKGQIF